MYTKNNFILYSLCFVFCMVFSVSVCAAPIQWQGWTDDLFVKARKQNKLVILDLEAVWCHWCHVMEEETYSKPYIQDVINQHFIAVRVDQDSRPDLSIKYRDYGWPATIIFNSKGEEISKSSGFLEPDTELLPLLNEVVRNPVPIAPKEKIKESSEGLLSEASKKIMLAKYEEVYDSKNKGWGRSHKFVHGDSAEWALTQGLKGKASDRKKLTETLTANLKLVDPVWGGVYQYSTGGVWVNAHFEKIMSTQVRNLKLYSQTYLLTGEKIYLETADKIFGYMQNFLKSPEGAFYPSQDADVVKGQHSEGFFKLNDKERRKQGIPAIDKHTYARENGWMVHAMTEYYKACDKPEVLKQAETTLQWVEKNRSLKSGGFTHGENTIKDNPLQLIYLGDNLAMAQAYLYLYEVTAETRYLKSAMKTADAMEKYFYKKEVPGVITFTKQPSGSPLSRLVDQFKNESFSVSESEVDRDENIEVARFMNLLYHYTGEARFKSLAQKPMKYLAHPEQAEYYPVGGTLQADFELSQDPLHITIVGPKADAMSAKLFKTAIKVPSLYKRVEWLDASGEKLINLDVKYPTLPQPAAFLCSGKKCSFPMTTEAELKAELKKQLSYN